MKNIFLSKLVAVGALAVARPTAYAQPELALQVHTHHKDGGLEASA